MKDQITFEKFPNGVEANVCFNGRPCLGQVYVEVDGYWAWDPASQSGYFSAHVLRAIADKLDEWNKQWDEEVQRDLAAAPSMDSDA